MDEWMGEWEGTDELMCERGWMGSGGCVGGDGWGVEAV